MKIDVSQLLPEISNPTSSRLSLRNRISELTIEILGNSHLSVPTDEVMQLNALLIIDFPAGRNMADNKFSLVLFYSYAELLFEAKSFHISNITLCFEKQ